MTAGIREVFTLGGAERTVEGYGAERLATVKTVKSGARERMVAARRLSNPHAATELLREALEHGLRGLHAARGVAGPFRPLDELAFLETQSASPPKASQLRAARWLFEHDGLQSLDFGEAEGLRDEAAALVDHLLRRVESRTATELAGLRVGRTLAVVLVVVYLGATWIRDHYLVHNVALHKPVTTSGLRFNPPPPDAVVDGRTRAPFGVHTNEGPHPFVTVDLERVYDVRRVRVYNRGDGWFDDVLPLTLETSTDGVHFQEVAQRNEHFMVWSVDLGQKPARYVRLTKDSGYIVLNEIEVYARE